MAEEEKKGSQDAGFVRLAYGVVSNAGYDVSNMPVDKVIELYNKLNGKNEKQNSAGKETSKQRSALWR